MLNLKSIAFYPDYHETQNPCVTLSPWKRRGHRQSIGGPKTG